MRLVLILFFGIAIASAIFFYIYRDHAMNIISQFLSELSGTGVIDEESNISVVGLWANNVRAASNTWLFGLVPFIYLPVLSVIINAGMMGILTGYIGATTGASFHALNDYLILKDRTAALVFGLTYLLEVHTHTVLLSPLQELRLEVHLLVGHLVDIDELRQYALLHEAHASVVTSVEINGSDKCLESIAAHVAVMRCGVVGGFDEL